MKYFDSYQKCIDWVKEKLDDYFTMVSSDFKDVYGYSEDVPGRLEGTYFLYRYRYYPFILEIVDDLCAVTRVEEQTGLLKEYTSNQYAIEHDYYKREIKEEHQGKKYVDLGLPSGLKWSLLDLSGWFRCSNTHYFSWGEVKCKEYYTPKTALKRTKFSDIKADSKMDAARVNWEGKWRMPTINDFEELLTLCEWKRRGRGYKVFGPNGNFIYLDCSSYWTCISKEGEDIAACLKVGKDKREICWEESFEGLLVRPVFSDEDVENIETFDNDPHAPEFSKGIVEREGKLTEKFVFVGEQSHKGGNRASVRGAIKTGDIVDITFLGASEEPISLREWNPVWEMDDSVSVMGEDFFFEVLVNGKKAFIGRDSGYRYTEHSTMGGGVKYHVERTRITQEEVISHFKAFKSWLQEGAKKDDGWHSFEKKSAVVHPIPNGLPMYPEPEDTTPDAPIGYKCVLLEKSDKKGGQVVYGKQFYYDSRKLTIASNKVARQVLASCRIGGGEYLDWEEDAGFGNAPSFADYIDCKGLRYAVVPLDEELKDGVDKDGVVISEQLYKSLLASHSIDWIDVK